MVNGKGFSVGSSGDSQLFYETWYNSTVYNNVYAGGIAINMGNMQYICVGPLQRLVLVKTLSMLQLLFTDSKEEL